MPNFMHPTDPFGCRPWILPALAAAVLACAPAAVQAEKADRDKPMVIRADKDGVWDMQRQVIVFSGNVTITQGTLRLVAERVEVRELPDGHRGATLIGSAAAPASYRQKRDHLDEFVEGQAERIEYDGRADVLRFSGASVVRRLRGSTVADEITGSTIVWDNTRELFSVSSGTPAGASAAGQDNRVRAVLGPRPQTQPDATSAPASAPPARGPGNTR